MMEDKDCGKSRERTESAGRTKEEPCKRESFAFRRLVGGVLSDGVTPEEVAHYHILRLAFDEAIKYYNMRHEIYCRIDNLYCGDMLFDHDVIGVMSIDAGTDGIVEAEMPFDAVVGNGPSDFISGFFIGKKTLLYKFYCICLTVGGGIL